MSYNGFNYSPYYQQSGNDGRGQNPYQGSASTNGRYQSSNYGPSSSPSGQQQPSSTHSYVPQQPQSSYTPTTTSADRSTISYSNYGDSPGTSQYQNRMRQAWNRVRAMDLEQETIDLCSRSLTITELRARVATAPLRSTTQGVPVQIIATNDHKAEARQVQGLTLETQRPRIGVFLRLVNTHSTGQQPVTILRPQLILRQRKTLGVRLTAHTSRRARSSAKAPTTHSPRDQPAGKATMRETPREMKNPNPAYWPEQTPSHQPTVTDRRSSESSAQVTGSTLPASGPTVTSAQRSNPPLTNTDNRQASRTPISSGEQAPTTVDPSRVFNNEEYQRRQAAAADAAAIKKAAEAEEEIRKATEAAAALKRVSESHSAEPNREEQMAAEMRQMIEKMRDYKSKDPSLFSQIWEQVKKTQPAGSVPAAPPEAAKDVPSTAAHGVYEVLNPSPAPSPGVIGGLPDLGKFPALRRRRGGKTDSPARKRKSGGKSTGADLNGSQPGPPIDPAIIEASNQSSQQTTQGAMSNSSAATAPAKKSQVIYVSGTGPQDPRLVDTDNASRPSNSYESASAPAPAPASAPAPAPASAPAPAPAPTSTSSTGKTAWPEHKKWDLAVAAKDVLLGMPVNSTKANSISPEHILAFLNENPSYERLCQMIESKGLIIERSHFARCLLEKVPGMGGAQRPASVNGQATNPGTPQPIGIGVGAYKKLRYAHHKQFTIPTPPPNSRTSDAPPVQMTPASQLPVPPQAAPTDEKPTVPLTKSEQARKRNILEIVDLSQLSDDEMPPPKVQRLDDQSENPRPPALNQPIDSLQPLSTLHTSHPPSYPALPYHPTYQAPASAALSSAPSSSASARQRELTNSEDIVKPIDERKARNRKRYDPKTIVRDVLLAAGRHPTMQPLNYHLDGLRKIFKHVNDMSDLSTFRWDLVDPGDPIPASVTQEIQPKTNAGEDDADGNDADDEEVVRQHAPQDRSGSFGPSVAVNTAAVALQNLARPPKLLGPHRKRPREHTNVDDSRISSAPATPQPSAHASTPNKEGSSTVKRRGRPPGSKNKHPRNSVGTPSQSITTSRPRIDTTPAQPSGLRNSVASGDGLAVVVPSPSPSLNGTPRKRGRPRKSWPKTSPKTSQQTRSIHRIYKCHWEGCPAELHNLETLKKHVNKHGDKFKDQGGPFPCLWTGCGTAARNVEGADDDEMDIDAGRQPLQFGGHDAWAKHMDKRHISDYAWKLGDGPSIRSESEMSDYVSDSAKRQITPVIANQGRPDPLASTSGGDGVQEFHKAHGNVSEVDKAKAFMEASETRRESFGPGMDRTGATFVTKEKHALLDDSMGPLRKVPRKDA
ncbi:MAG: hypothetical protein LQ344_000750 [Seirophora lacunosa]|nr:MAG: hypothetical protein LQ344_000750 [Seirophora lacunosa]